MFANKKIIFLFYTLYAKKILICILQIGRARFKYHSEHRYALQIAVILLRRLSLLRPHRRTGTFHAQKLLPPAVSRHVYNNIITIRFRSLRQSLHGSVGRASRYIFRPVKNAAAVVINGEN